MQTTVPLCKEGRAKRREFENREYPISYPLKQKAVAHEATAKL